MVIKIADKEVFIPNSIVEFSKENEANALDLNVFVNDLAKALIEKFNEEHEDEKTVKNLNESINNLPYERIIAIGMRKGLEYYGIKLQKPEDIISDKCGDTINTILHHSILELGEQL